MRNILLFTSIVFFNFLIEAAFSQENCTCYCTDGWFTHEYGKVTNYKECEQICPNHYGKKYSIYSCDFSSIDKKNQNFKNDDSITHEKTDFFHKKQKDKKIIHNPEKNLRLPPMNENS
jgi:hypothetical protein